MAKWRPRDITERFSPRVGTNGLGVYPLTTDDVHLFFLDLWSTSFMEKVSNWLLGDPMDSILGIRWYYGINHLIERKADCYVTIGDTAFNGIIGSDKPLISGPAGSEYVHIDAGSITIPRKYQDFRDVEPFTAYELYIPFVGVVPLKGSDITHSYYPEYSYDTSINLSYNINLITGAAIATVERYDMGQKREVLLTAQCQIGVDIPININGKEELSSRIITGLSATAIAGGMALAAPAMVGAAAGAAAGVGARAIAGEAIVSGLGNAITATMSGPAENSKGGMLDGEMASMASFQPRLRIIRKKTAAPDNYKEVIGMPNHSTIRMSRAEGYIKVAAIANTTNSGYWGIDMKPAIPQEAREEITRLLKSGVFVNGRI